MADGRTPLVYLVGAGPGDPGLLTLRAVECLGRADLVLHDKLVPPRMLAYARPGAECVSVESLPGEHPQRWPHVHQTMIDAARQGKVVVRLKGGDPHVFGRGTEEAESLRQAGIPYEFVPGITAALAVASYAEIPLTHRACASAVAFITGHENPTKPESSVDWSLLAKFPGTLVIYMGMARLELIVKMLLENGKPADTPAAVVQTASTGHQITRITTLATLDRMVRDEGLAAPAIIMIGPVVSFRPPASWFESELLFGKRVLVTRPRHQANEMLRKLEELGAITYLLPAVEITDPPDWSPVDAAIARLAEYDWLVFTSANGVTQFFKRLFQSGRDVRAAGHLKFATIGPATAEALKAFHLTADLVPASFRSEEFALELKPRVAGKCVLLARADRGRELLRQELSAVAQVEQITVYSQIDAIDPDSDVLLALSRGEIGYVTLTSSNIARAVLGSLDETARMRIHEGAVQLASISPVTSAAIRELGFPVAVEAAEYTVDGLVAALANHAQHPLTGVR
ncbi:MAG: uroporphyrinogen-III C-methyltransferase [Gemmataceae bacterium]